MIKKQVIYTQITADSNKLVPIPNTMLNKFIFQILLLLSIQVAYSQNILSNGDFENYSSLPNDYGQSNFATGWSNVNGNYSGPPYGSPDYYHTSGTVGSAFGPILPFSGNAQMGFCTYHSSLNNYREYLSTQLKCPTIAGHQYQVSFYLTNGNGGVYSMSTNGIGVHFSNSPLKQLIGAPIPVIPQIEITSTTYLNNLWQLYTLKFTAINTDNYITIGNFRDDANTSLGTSSGQIGAYYFIDKISVTNLTQNSFLGNDTTLCQGQTLALNAGTANSYLWSNSSTASSINVSTAGTYWVQANNGQCSYTDSINIIYNSAPTFNLGNDTALCQGQTLALNAGTANSYLWSNSSTASSINVSNSGSYWVQASNEQCSYTDSINIIFNSVPSVNLGNDTTLCQGQTLTLHAGTANSYLWSNSSTASSINVSTSGTYWVQASNGQCSERDSLSINISNCEIEIELPNVFTPNNDGVNDNFTPLKYTGITKATLKIFNRWGLELFYTDNLLQGWNGYYNGNSCSDGTYYWIVQYTTITNESQEIKGFLTLIN